MSYVRQKKVPAKDGKSHTYYQLVRGYRENGQVKQEVLAHLGPHATPDEALADWEKRAHWARELAVRQQSRADAVRNDPMSQRYDVEYYEASAAENIDRAGRFEEKIRSLRAAL